MSPIYPYECKNGHYDEIDKPVKFCSQNEHCQQCGLLMQRIYTMPAITGTRDSFGIGRKFVDEKTGKEITTWREWNKAGYSDPLKDGVKDVRGNKHAQLKEAVKRREFKAKKRFSVQMKGGS